MSSYRALVERERIRPVCEPLVPNNIIRRFSAPVVSPRTRAPTLGRRIHGTGVVVLAPLWVGRHEHPRRLEPSLLGDEVERERGIRDVKVEIEHYCRVTRVENNPNQLCGLLERMGRRAIRGGVARRRAARLRHVGRVVVKRICDVC